MDRQLQLYWQAFDELVSTVDILKADSNPVYQYEDQLVDGAIVDIGCGQTSALLRYANIAGRKLIGVDNDAYQLKRLSNRLIEINGQESKEWDLVLSDLQRDPLPSGNYSMVILYNILHFFSLRDCDTLIKKLDKHLAKGALISVCVHSTKYHANNPANPDNKEYFKHYFAQTDLDELFPSKGFHKIYSADVERIIGKRDQEVVALWAEKVIEDMNITNDKEKASIRHQANNNHLDADLICVYRKR